MTELQQLIILCTILCMPVFTFWFCNIHHLLWIKSTERIIKNNRVIFNRHTYWPILFSFGFFMFVIISLSTEKMSLIQRIALWASLWIIFVVKRVAENFDLLPRKILLIINEKGIEGPFWEFTPWHKIKNIEATRVKHGVKSPVVEVVRFNFSHKWHREIPIRELGMPVKDFLTKIKKYYSGPIENRLSKN